MKISYLFSKLMNVIFIYTRMIVHISCYSVIIKQNFFTCFSIDCKKPGWFMLCTFVWRNWIFSDIIIILGLRFKSE